MSFKLVICRPFCYSIKKNTEGSVAKARVDFRLCSKEEVLVFFLLYSDPR